MSRGRRAERQRIRERGSKATTEAELRAEIRRLQGEIGQRDSIIHSQRSAIGAMRRRVERANDPSISRRQVAATRRALKNQPRFEGLTAAESAFVEKALERRWELYRNGWPDFLCYESETRTHFFVEVKGPGDSLSEAQERMCAVLEEIGIQVRIFRPHKPGALVHWRKYRNPERSPRTRAGGHLLEPDKPESTGGAPWSACGPETEGSGRVH